MRIILGAAELFCFSMPILFDGLDRGKPIAPEKDLELVLSNLPAGIAASGSDKKAPLVRPPLERLIWRRAAQCCKDDDGGHKGNESIHYFPSSCPMEKVVRPVSEASSAEEIIALRPDAARDIKTDEKLRRDTTNQTD